MATYLELVNSVLKRMREAQVASITENALSTLIGEFVNDAKREIEDSWNWTVLRTSGTFNTVAGTSVYSLATSIPTLNVRARPFVDPDTSQNQVYITTLHYESQLDITNANDPSFLVLQTQASNANTQAVPTNFYLTNGVASATQTGLSINLYPIPDGIYTVASYWINPQNDLSGAGDTLSIPKDPVIQLAYVYGLYERGEELGEALLKAEAKAGETLSDAIAIDQALSQSAPKFSNN